MVTIVLIDVVCIRTVYYITQNAAYHCSSGNKIYSIFNGSLGTVVLRKITLQWRMQAASEIVLQILKKNHMPKIFLMRNL